MGLESWGAWLLSWGMFSRYFPQRSSRNPKEHWDACFGATMLLSSCIFTIVKKFVSMLGPISVSSWLLLPDLQNAGNYPGLLGGGIMTVNDDNNNMANAFWGLTCLGALLMTCVTSFNPQTSQWGRCFCSLHRLTEWVWRGHLALQVAAWYLTSLDGAPILGRCTTNSI